MPYISRHQQTSAELERSDYGFSKDFATCGGLFRGLRRAGADRPLGAPGDDGDRGVCDGDWSGDVGLEGSHLDRYGGIVKKP